MKKPVSVLIVDDSAVVRDAARHLLEQHSDIRVLDTAIDPLLATEIMRREWPDVIVLDIQMPRMDGLTFLRRIMSEHPTPVVICSTLVGNGAQAGLDALALGAVSLISKPKLGVRAFFDDESDNIVAAVRAAAQTNLARLHHIATHPSIFRPIAGKPARSTGTTSLERRIIAMGASTGGTQAFETVLSSLPANLPGIVMVQHMPTGFSRRFADRLNESLALELREARNGDRVEPGLALLAEAGRHMRLKSDGRGYFVEIVDGPPVSRHRPSVDYLFRSVAKAAGQNAIGILMTGMGDDGAQGLKEMRDRGAHTLAEAEQTCVVFGMPKQAIALGGVSEVVPLDGIADSLTHWVRKFT